MTTSARLLAPLAASLLLYACSSTAPSPQAPAAKNLGEGIEDLSRQIIGEMSGQQKSTLAVIEFSDLDGRTNTMGKLLSEELITNLYKTQKFQVIERNLLKKLLKEIKMDMSGMVDGSSAKELGKLAGADAICSGTITDLGETIRVNARLISVETGNIFGAASTQIIQDNTVKRLMGSAGPPASAGPAPAAAPADAFVDSLQVIDFTFRLRSCQQSGTTVRCALQITNDAGQRQRLGLYAIQYQKSQLYAAGKNYVVSRIKLGNEETEYGPITLPMPAGISVESVVYFEDVDAALAQIDALDLMCFEGTYRNVSHVEFAGIKLQGN